MDIDEAIPADIDEAIPAYSRALNADACDGSDVDEAIWGGKNSDSSDDGLTASQRE